MGNLIFYMGFNDTSIIWDAIRGLLSWFDSIVYSVLGWFFQTIFYVSNFQMNMLYDEVQERVYVILGIFMLFKLVVSFLSYLVNPDKISDKEQGVGKVVTRIMATLVMLLALPTLFTVMTDLQNRLIPVIPRLIIGQSAAGDFFSEDSETGNTVMQVPDLGNAMAITAYRAFLRENEACSVNSTSDDNDNDNDSTSMAYMWNTMSEAVSHVNDPCPDNPDIYQYTYTPIIPLIVGIIMVVVVLGINLDIGMRSFKLLILRAIAPIPIISYIDPKSSKDGAFSKWTKMLFTTWTSLFINLGIVYLVIYLIQMLFSADVRSNFFANFTSPNPLINSLVLILVVVALLFFAREAPQFILDALGIKSAGSFGKVLGLAASGLGMVGAARASYQASKKADEVLKDERKPSLLRNVGAGLFGGLASGMAGAHAVLGAKDGQIKAGMDVISKRNATALARGSAGSTLGGRLLESAYQVFTGETKHDQEKRDVKNKEQFINAASTFDKNLKAEAIKGKYGPVTVSGSYLGDKNITGNSKSLRAQAQIAISKGEEWFYYDNGTGITKKVSTTDYESVASDMEKQEMESLYREFAAGRDHGNVDLYQEYLTATESANSLGYKFSTRKELDEERKVAAADVAQTKRSTSYQAGEANSNAVKK